MAERRMFSKKITESDAFLDMPLSTQCLYFHLNMAADDDGFVNNPKRIQRMLGASDDDFKLLIAKNFVLLFESGIIVIKHWKIHNYIQSDRYKKTNYTDEMSQLEVKANKSYAMPVSKMDTNCIQDVSVGKDSIGKDSIVEDSIEEYKGYTDKPEAQTKATKHKYGEYKHVLLTDIEYTSLATAYGEALRDKAIRFLDLYIEEKGYKSNSHNLAIRRWVVDAVNERDAKSRTHKPAREESAHETLERLRREGAFDDGRGDQ